MITQPLKGHLQLIFVGDPERRQQNFDLRQFFGFVVLQFFVEIEESFVERVRKVFKCKQPTLVVVLFVVRPERKLEHISQKLASL
jgi:hypothetical protein